MRHWYLIVGKKDGNSGKMLAYWQWAMVTVANGCSGNGDNGGYGGNGGLIKKKIEKGLT